MKINTIKTKVNFLNNNLKLFDKSQTKGYDDHMNNIANCLILSVVKDIYFNTACWKWESRDRPRPKLHLSPDTHTTVYSGCPENVIT